MRISSTIRFYDPSLKKSFLKLKEGDESEKELFKFLSQAIQNIEENAFCGIRIPKKIIPKEYKVNNLWKYDLPKGWRLVYSLESTEVYIVSIILEWFNHKEYENRFKY